MNLQWLFQNQSPDNPPPQLWTDLFSIFVYVFILSLESILLFLCQQFFKMPLNRQESITRRSLHCHQLVILSNFPERKLPHSSNIVLLSKQNLKSQPSQYGQSFLHRCFYPILMFKNIYTYIFFKYTWMSFPSKQINVFRSIVQSHRRLPLILTSQALTTLCLKITYLEIWKAELDIYSALLLQNKHCIAKKIVIICNNNGLIVSVCGGTTHHTESQSVQSMKKSTRQLQPRQAIYNTSWID